MRRRALLRAAVAAAAVGPVRAAGPSLPLPVEGGARVLVDGDALVLVDAQGREWRRQPGRDLAGRRHGPPQVLLWHAGRRSVIATFPAFDEVWELSLDPAAPPVYDGLVHDWRMGEGIPTPGFFTPRRIVLPPPMPARWFVEAAWPWIAGALDDEVLVLHLDVRRTVARLPVRGARLQEARRVLRDGRELWRLPGADGERLVDPKRWVVVQSG